MFNHGDRSGIGGLEEVFRSSEFGRSIGTLGGGVSDAPGREDVILAREFRRPRTSAPLASRDEAHDGPMPRAGEPHPASQEGTGSLQRPLPVGHSASNAPGAQHVETSSTVVSKGRATRYKTMACLGALLALVGAGIVAGADHHPPSNIAAQGQRSTARPHGGSRPAGRPMTGSPALSAPPQAAAGSGGPPSGTGASGVSGQGPAGHVTLVGPATFTGTPGSPAPVVSPPSGGTGTTGSPQPSASTNPVAPVPSTLGSTVSVVGSSVATTAGQIAGAVPPAAPAAGVVNTVVNTLDQAAGALAG